MSLWRGIVSVGRVTTTGTRAWPTRWFTTTTRTTATTATARRFVVVVHDGDSGCCDIQSNVYNNKKTFVLGSSLSLPWSNAIVSKRTFASSAFVETCCRGYSSTRSLSSFLSSLVPERTRNCRSNSSSSNSNSNSPPSSSTATDPPTTKDHATASTINPVSSTLSSNDDNTETSTEATNKIQQQQQQQQIEKQLQRERSKAEWESSLNESRTGDNNNNNNNNNNDPFVLVYENPLGMLVTRLRIFSISTTIMAVVVVPTYVVVVKDGEFPVALSSSFGTLSFIMTVVVHVIFRPFVYRAQLVNSHSSSSSSTTTTTDATTTDATPNNTNTNDIHQNDNEETNPVIVRIMTRNLFLMPHWTEFDITRDVRAYDGIHPLCNLDVKGVPHHLLTEYVAMEPLLGMLTRLGLNDPMTKPTGVAGRNPDEYL